MINLSALAAGTNAVGALANLILVNPKNVSGITPQDTSAKQSLFGTSSSLFNPKSFLFHYEGENTITLDSDTTDHYVEDNTAIQDHVARRPVTVTTHGYIGELNNVTPGVLQPLKLAADTLTALSPYTPALSATALIAYNQAAQAYAIAANAANVAIAAFDTATGQEIQNLQQQAFTLFYGYWQTNQLFEVRTPWAKFDNMLIKTLRAVQDEETQTVTDFEITFKQMRFAKTVSATRAVLQSTRAANQSSIGVDFGSNNLNPGDAFHL